jgi:hypothetical protein
MGFLIEALDGDRKRRSISLICHHFSAEVDPSLAQAAVDFLRRTKLANRSKKAMAGWRHGAIWRYLRRINHSPSNLQAHEPGKGALRVGRRRLGKARSARASTVTWRLLQ